MYKERFIKFKEIVSINQWKVKTYTISKNETFEANTTYQKALLNMPTWLSHLNTFDPSHENIAFLIVHEGTEGVFTLINTWVGSNMLQTHIYISKYNDLATFDKISGDGLFACVWELEIINHERNSWIVNILKKDEDPDYGTYLNETLTIKL